MAQLNDVVLPGSEDDVGVSGTLNNPLPVHRLPPALALAASLALSACGPAPSADVSSEPAPSATVGAASTPSAEPTVGSNPSPPPPPPPMTSGDKIREAVSSGRLDPWTGIGYRVLAIFGDEHVPDAYIVVAPGLSGARLESTLAHGFFHVLEASHNRRGTWDCPVRRLGSCSDADLEYHWFVEASAKWSEEYFVSRARPAMVYPWFTTFQATRVGLADTVSANEYASFTWPLFMQQEGGATKIRDA